MDNLIRLFRQCIFGEDHPEDIRLILDQSRGISTYAYDKGEILARYVLDLLLVGNNEVTYYKA